MRWEYRTITENCERSESVGTLALDPSNIRKLNALGVEGWELVSAVPLIQDDTTWAVSFVFKRPLDLEPAWR